MPLLGLLDWIVIAVIALIGQLLLTCYLLLHLYEWVSFKPKTYYRNATQFKGEDGQLRLIQAPTISEDHRYAREEKLKWYHQMILGV